MTQIALEIESVMAGSVIVRAGEEQVALGFPEEVVKGWLRAGAEVSAWIIPDLRSDGGVVQWALEFPLYHALFVRGLFAKGRKIPVLVHQRDWPDVVEYLRLTLLGLGREELAREGVAAETADMLVAEGAHLALKRADGSVAGIEDFLEPRFFSAEGLAELGPLTVRSHGANVYSFFTAEDRIEEFRLEPAGALPPYAASLPAAQTPTAPQPFEVIALGAGHGFDVAGPCSNLAAQVGGRFVLVDCGPYIRTLLERAGIALSQVDAVIVTHAHEDHAVGLCALLGLGHRPKLYAARETAAVLRRKLAILNPTLASPATLLDDAFDLELVRAGETAHHLGLELRFHYTLHSIPCTGVELRARDAGGAERRVLVVGDNASRAAIERAAAAGAMAPARARQLLELYRWDGDIVFADAGAGAIHGEPADFRDCPAANVVYLHTAALRPEERDRYTQAAPGARYTLIAESHRPSALERSIAERALGEAFPPARERPEWLGALLDAALALDANRGQLLLRRGERSSDLFVTLAGELEVLVADGAGNPVRIAELHAGEIFGEMAAIREAPRSASVRATTPARLLRIPGTLFRSFALATRIAGSLPEQWRARADLERVSILARASVTTRNLLARRAERRAVGAGSTLIREGSPTTTVYVLVSGRVQVYRGSEPLLVGGAPVILEPGAIIGETAPFLRQPRNASVVTLDECEVLALRGSHFKEIVERSPELLCRVSSIVRQRAAEQRAAA
jgi:CRP-like cAMP-binding protein/glyoxylase-like metal-dependent hydrolase (beta-lactamase superfamily II)